MAIKVKPSDWLMIIGVAFITVGEFVYQKEKKESKKESERIWAEAKQAEEKAKETPNPLEDVEVPFATD